MSKKIPDIRALGLSSGGLDSILAALVLRKAGVEVEWVGFETPFFSAAKAEKAAHETGIPIRTIDITDRYLKILRNPRFGYGKNMNPCLDCHALMLTCAGELMAKGGFAFLFTGEVLGQRPMSQTRPSLRCVEKASGLSGYVLRPLSAKLLPETIPEERGWVDRCLLLDLSGRSRKRQVELAREFGLTDYPAPAGGCLLTDVTYSRRLKDLFAHQAGYNARDLDLLKAGRHFRFGEGGKIIVGRTREDNARIQNLTCKRGDIILKMSDFPGPLVLIPGGAEEEIIDKAAVICAAYGKASAGEEARVTVIRDERTEFIVVTAVSPAEFSEYMI